MSTPDTSIDPRILESARKAFLKNGFAAAQLKDICSDAGVTTGALYKRYKSKEELFCALVRPAVDDITALINTRESTDPESLSDEALLGSWGMQESSEVTFSMQGLFDFLYARKDEFTLLLSCSEGTRYSGFTKQWVERMSDGTYRFLQEAVRRNMADKPVSRKELGVLMSAFWTMLYEPFLRGFRHKEIEEHCLLLNEMFNWQKIFGIHMPG